MITSVRLVNFKNFADETLRVGPFTVIVGANASGKSNIRDAFRFLHGIGRGYTLAEIMGGKFGEEGYRAWDGIRGAPGEIVRLERVYVYDWSTFALHLELNIEGEQIFYYIKVGFHPNSGFILLEEQLRAESGLLFATIERGDSNNLSLVIGNANEELTGISRLMPALSQVRNYIAHGLPQLSVKISQSHELMILRVLTAILGIRFLELVPEQMRGPSIPGAYLLGDSGENLPTVIEEICADPARRDILTSWLQELTPMDVKEFEFPRDPSGRVHLRIVERDGRKLSAYSASDGTLRFLGMLAALLGPINASGIYFFEEIDNGIHPSRLWLLVDLIEQQTAKGVVQFITTTHSPEMLNFINDTTFEYTSVTFRAEKSADAIIRPVAELPNARELRKSQGLGRLHSGAWMETALAFTEGGYDEDSEVGK